MKIITVCTMGIGTSILLKMNIETALGTMGVQADVEASDLGSARAAARGADLIMTNTEVAHSLEGSTVPIATIQNFMDLDEIKTALDLHLPPSKAPQEFM